MKKSSLTSCKTRKGAFDIYIQTSMNQRVSRPDGFQSNPLTQKD